MQCVKIEDPGILPGTFGRVLVYGIILCMRTENTRIQVQEELLLAKQSRIEGNEGRARVCARRAAGTAVANFLNQKNDLNEPTTVLQALIAFQNTKELPERVQLALARLVQQVDQQYQLPPGVDLIEEAKLLISYTEIGD